MNCKECEKIIYLYHESSDKDRQAMEEHVKACTSCSKLFEEVKATSVMVKEAGKVVHAADNPSLLTGRIMNVLPEGKPNQSWLNYLPGFFDLSTAKYSMAAISVILSILFVVEIRGPGKPIDTLPGIRPNTAGIVLRSDNLREDLVSRREKKSLFTECTKKMKQIDVDCIKEKIEKLSF